MKLLLILIIIPCFLLLLLNVVLFFVSRAEPPKPYKSNVYFPRNGTYKFKIQHGMRVEDLKGIYDIGMKIEKIRIK